MKKLKLHNQGGYIALITVLIIVAVTLAIGVSINLLSISESQIGLMQEQAGMAFATADACVDEAMMRLKNDPGYAGVSLNFASGTCTIVITAQGTTRTIRAEGSVATFTRAIQADVSLIGNQILLTAWREI